MRLCKRLPKVSDLYIYENYPIWGSRENTQTWAIWNKYGGHVLKSGGYGLGCTWWSMPFLHVNLRRDPWEALLHKPIADATHQERTLNRSYIYGKISIGVNRLLGCEHRTDGGEALLSPSLKALRIQFSRRERGRWGEYQAGWVFNGVPDREWATNGLRLDTVCGGNPWYGRNRG